MDDYKIQEKLHYNRRYQEVSTSPEKANSYYDIVNENAVQYFYDLVKGLTKGKGKIKVLDYGCGEVDPKNWTVA